MIDTENINNFGIVPQYWFIDTSSMTLCCHGVYTTVVCLIYFDKFG